ncbi:MAG: JAB domain-containing protein [Agriterribacter sp.]
MISSKEWNMVSEVELIYKVNVKPSLRPKVSNSIEIYNILVNYFDENKIGLQETFYVMYVNQSLSVLGIIHLSSGGITATIVDPRLILATAIKLSACGIILSHSHPSGNLKPSAADPMLTEKITCWNLS